MSRKKTESRHPRRRGGPSRAAGRIHPVEVRRALQKLPHSCGKTQEIARAMKLDADGRKRLDACLRHMLRRGELEYHGKRLRLAGARTVVGTLSLHPDGFGFVCFDDKTRPDLYLAREETRGLMHGDRIEVQPYRRRGRMAARLVRVVEAADAVLTGQFRILSGVGFVEPRSSRYPTNIVVDKRGGGNAHDGDWVRIEVERGTVPMRGRVVEVLEDVMRASALVDLVVAEQKLPGAFPDDVLAEAEEVPERVTAAQRRDRLDLTRLPFVTIDGEDARDFDDAICVHRRGEGFEAWVAIADVAEYVRPDSPLDAEALARGNSFYFPDRVIPMLPERLSNGICSLNPDVPRLCMAVRMRYDAGGRRRSAQVHEVVIHSHARLTYNEVSRLLDDGDETAVPAELQPMLGHAAELLGLLERHRHRRGALDLDLPETRAVIEDDDVRRLETRERNTAHHLVEEMMLAANTAVADYLEERDTPLLYRVHAPPEPESIEALNEFLAPFGLTIPLHAARPPKPRDLQRILERAEDEPFAHVLHRLVLRAMQQAEYNPRNAGHFGLAYDAYCHFTSPIRRYADLTVHRQLKTLLRSDAAQRRYRTPRLAEIGKHVSRQERKQTRSEWDTGAMLAALYHRRDAGKTFEAVVGGVTRRRVFLELQPTLAEGSIAVDDLDNRYSLDERLHRLVSHGGHETIAIGDRVTVVVESVDPPRGQINLRFAEKIA